MKRSTTLLAAFGIAVTGSAAFAQDMMAPAEITCDDFAGMDEAGQMAVAEAVVAELESTAAPDAMMIQIENACEADTEAKSVLTAATAGATD